MAFAFQERRRKLPDFGIKQGLAAAYGDSGRIEETIAALKKSLSIDPSNSGTIYAATPAGVVKTKDGADT